MNNNPRHLIWIEGRMVHGCSECDWLFNPSDPPIGESLNDMKSNFRASLSSEFDSHSCETSPRTATREALGRDFSAQKR
jgi:hypothetical protein